jgi:diadenosine tetraphosphate (Ap4A) HIT family hydrolase
MLAPNCDFCNEFSGATENAFSRIYGQGPKSRVLFSDQGLVVIPSLGQIVEGHLLVVPTGHLTALGDLPEAHVEEFETLCGQVRAVLEREYGSCIFFEHGTRSVSAGGCGVYHAHLHAVPLPAALEPLEFLTSQFLSNELVDLSEIGEMTGGSASYLFYQDSRVRSYVFRTDALPSQYMRKLLAERLGSKDWDWRTAGRERQLLATLARLSGRFHDLAVHEVTNGADR